MKDLRLIGHESGAIQLESLDGEKFRLSVDESVRSAVKLALSESQEVEPISPREIQDRIRAGASVDDIVAISGASQSYIEKFAKPVLDELSHMVDAALAIRITIAGDRFNDEVQEEFGRIIESRLFASGARHISWSSKRVDVGAWHSMARFELGDEEGQALWLFEPRKYLLAPENETAVTLSNHDSNLDGPIPKLRPVIATNPKTESVERTATVTPFPVVREQKAEPVEIATDVPAAFRRDSEDRSDQLAQLQRQREEQARLAEIAAQEAVTEFPETIPEATIELIDSAGDADTQSDFEQELAADTDSESSSEAVDDGINSAREPKKGRAAMPSWDEIVFGTKADD